MQIDQTLKIKSNISLGLFVCDLRSPKASFAAEKRRFRLRGPHIAFSYKSYRCDFNAFLGVFGAGRRSIFNFLRLRAPFLNPTKKLKNMMAIDHKKAHQSDICDILHHFDVFYIFFHGQIAKNGQK